MIKHADLTKYQPEVSPVSLVYYVLLPRRENSFGEMITDDIPAKVLGFTSKQGFNKRTGGHEV